MNEPERPPEKRRRTSITKLQRQTAAGAELIALCQTVTEDGALIDDEVAALEQWLADHRHSDLPARDFLFSTIERILADREVTPAERKELYHAVETILPPDVRESVRGKRMAVEKAARDETRLTRETVRQAQREAKARNAPVDTWDFMVAGVWYEGRHQVIRQFAEPGDVAFLVRDRCNRFSRNAVEIRLTNGMQIGLVPEEHAVKMAPMLDIGHRHGAYIKKILTGGRAPIPVVVAYLYSSEADRQDAVTESQVPPAQKAPPFEEPSLTRSSKRGCLSTLLLIGSFLAGLAFFVRALSLNTG